MLMLKAQSNSAASHAMQFAKGLLGAKAAAFYDVDEELNPRGFLLSDVPIEFHRTYVNRMYRFDPLHPRHASARSVARLTDAFEQDATSGTATFRSFSSEFGVSDIVEFFFRRHDRIVAGMSLVWGQQSRVPDGVMHVADQMHDYLEFNLVGAVDSGIGEALRYGLTAREHDVVDLLCCGRTNREISECLSISLATVKTHLIHIFEKLGVETRSAAVALMTRSNSTR